VSPAMSGVHLSPWNVFAEKPDVTRITYPR